ncbi:MAG TPA: nickel-binding protein [Candidatus Sulfotelmatobacter sp.]|nr:nickel-binding protein [Candidatus Sulfotelmatobacter sp.]
MGETPTSFVAECFWTGVTDGDLGALDERVESIVAEMNRRGENVRYLGSMLMREDEVVMCFFEGTAENVRQAADSAQVPYERILETTRSGGHDATHRSTP